MSTLTVAYGHRSVKVTASPGTPTGELLAAAAKKLKLDPATVGLFHKGTELSSGLPYRLLNLPAGAKLEIRPIALKKPSEITVKIQFINAPFAQGSVVKKLLNSLTLTELIVLLEAELGPLLNQGHVLKFRSFTKTVGEELLGTKLSDIGLENHGVLHVLFENAANPPSALTSDTLDSETRPNSAKPAHESVEAARPVLEATPTEAEDTPRQTAVDIIQQPTEKIELSPEDEAYKNMIVKQIKDQMAQQAKEDEMVKASRQELEKKEVPKHVYVYAPPSAPLPVDEPEESTYDLTVSHAQTYQKMLSTYATDSDKKRRIRKQVAKSRINNVEVRIRFMDQSILQVNFRPAETNADLYDFVSKSLVDDEKFQLEIPHPHELITNDQSSLTRQLDSRNLLLFKSSKKQGPFLKPEYLQQARELQEALDDEMQVDTVDEPTSDAKIHNGILPKKNTGTATPSATGNKVPKWFKLGK